MNLESANLILRTSSIAVGADKDSNRTNITWRNINMKYVLGSLYYKYDKFKICLTSIGNVNTTTITNVSDRILAVNMRGLIWLNQTYDTAIRSNSDSSVISTALFNSANGFSINYTGEIGWVFLRPPSDTVDLTIFLSKVSDGSIPTGINYGESVFCFSIYGVPDDDDKKQKH